LNFFPVILNSNSDSLTDFVIVIRLTNYHFPIIEDHAELHIFCLPALF